MGLAQTEPCRQIESHMRTPNSCLFFFSRNSFRSLLHQLCFLSWCKYFKDIFHSLWSSWVCSCCRICD
jgi:hypothetical protein